MRGRPCSFTEFRNLSQLSSNIGHKKSLQPAELPDPLEVESYLEELLMLCQRSEEYNTFMLHRMQGGAVRTFL